MPAIAAAPANARRKLRQIDKQTLEALDPLRRLFVESLIRKGEVKLIEATGNV